MDPFNPVSTYRLQFNQSFTLKDAESILPYLYKSGIRTIYASPVLQAVKGSNHGYDVTNPLKINPEIGTTADFEQLTEKVHEYSMGWIQDIVPNHMAFSTENPWIYDVLEKGKDSEFYEYFDIFENHPDPLLNGKLMLPFFGKSLNELLQDKELSVVFGQGGFKLKYFENEYPLSVPAYAVVLKSAGRFPLPGEAAVFLNDENAAGDFNSNVEKLAASHTGSGELREFIGTCLKNTNSNPEKLQEVIDKLYYYPAFWRDTEKKINYRRFFTINGLICLNVQNERVFDACHRLVKEWITNKMIDGLRVDHIDGLYNPTEYLERLRSLAGRETVIYVEKILEEEEALPSHWTVEGSTGYDFLSLVNNLLTNRDTGPVFNSFYSDWIKKPVNYEDVFYSKSRFILYKRLAGELDNLTRQCMTLQPVVKVEPDSKKIKAAIGEFLVACPVYKVYNAPSNFIEENVEMVKFTCDRAVKKNPELKNTLQMLGELFLLKLPGSRNDVPKLDAFFRRCMQFAGPLMAKGIEDTAFYSFNAFIGHNEVGDSPGYFGIGADKFHHAMEERLKNRPLSMNALSTHDTKRGEDARARLNVLSDMPVKWMDEARRWRDDNRKHKTFIEDREIPTPNDEYLIYQVLCAHLPMNAKAGDSFKSRLEDYLVKAMREAKVNSSWSNPDEAYENETLNFVRKILAPDSAFPERLARFMEQIIPHGIVNSITQVVLRNTVPGVPDTFQGTETWNLSFVDPDNRQPVDYLQLMENIGALEKAYPEDAAALAEKHFENPLSGQLKQWVNWLTLKERARHPDLFLKGSYIPLKVIGKYHKRVIAYYRSHGAQHLVVILPLSTARLEGDALWEDTQIRLPESAPSTLINILTGEEIETVKSLHLEDVFDVVPFAVLRNKNS